MVPTPYPFDMYEASITLTPSSQLKSSLCRGIGAVNRRVVDKGRKKGTGECCRVVCKERKRGTGRVCLATAKSGEFGSLTGLPPETVKFSGLKESPRTFEDRTRFATLIASFFLDRGLSVRLEIVLSLA